MLENDLQLQITRGWIIAFQADLDALREAGPGQDVHPLLHQAELDALAFKIEEFKKEEKEYLDRISML